MKVYYSCNCRQCRMVSSKVRGMHKDRAHKQWRRKSRRALRQGDWEIPLVNTSYKS